MKAQGTAVGSAPKGHQQSTSDHLCQPLTPAQARAQASSPRGALSVPSRAGSGAAARLLPWHPLFPPVASRQEETDPTPSAGNCCPLLQLSSSSQGLTFRAFSLSGCRRCKKLLAKSRTKPKRPLCMWEAAPVHGEASLLFSQHCKVHQQELIYLVSTV